MQERSCSDRRPPAFQFRRQAGKQLASSKSSSSCTCKCEFQREHVYLLIFLPDTWARNRCKNDNAKNRYGCPEDVCVVSHAEFKQVSSLPQSPPHLPGLLVDLRPSRIKFLHRPDRPLPKGLPAGHANARRALWGQAYDLEVILQETPSMNEAIGSSTIVQASSWGQKAQLLSCCVEKYPRRSCASRSPATCIFRKESKLSK